MKVEEPTIGLSSSASKSTTSRGRCGGYSAGACGAMAVLRYAHCTGARFLPQQLAGQWRIRLRETASADRVLMACAYKLRLTYYKWV